MIMAISKNMSLQYLIGNMLKIVIRKMIGKSNVLSTVYHISGNSTIQLNNVVFIRNKLMDKFLRIKSNSSAIIQNNTLTENKFSWSVFDIENNSIMHLKNVIFTKNKLMGALLWLK